ncbi:hypothetical protein [Croceibacter atlanticus]|uniref:hypothetical protein n=1 Tax=Croceibacter atlanticus TaxID=313588 RepID=UPI0030DD8F1D|tara:strand:- start:359 stop:1138 length:780 start_codon:yes stop_codon:yes gene_type:complete
MAWSETVTEFIRRINPVKLFFWGLFATLLVFLWSIKGEAFEYMNNSDERKYQRMLDKIELERKVRQELDSVELEKNKLETELFMYKNGSINDIMYALERRVKSSSSISIYSIHNGGGTPVTGGDKRLSVLYTQDNVRGVDIMKEYGGKGILLTPGYAEYSERLLMLKGLGYYVTDVKKNSSIYEPQTQPYLDKHDTKSMFGCYIKTGPTATYYLSISFDHIAGMNLEGYDRVRNLMYDARDKLKDLLDVEQVSKKFKNS